MKHTDQIIQIRRNVMRTIDVNGTRVAFIDEGMGQPVVLLHSSTGSKGQWRAAISDWADRCRVIAPDLIGYGDSGPWTGLNALTLADEVELVAAVIEHTDSPVHLIGHSYGGAVALHTAMKLGTRIASLSLVEPTPFYLLPQASDDEPSALTDFEEIGTVARDIGDSLAAEFPMAAAHRFIDYWCGNGSWANLASDRQCMVRKQMHKVQRDFHALLCEETLLTTVAALRTPMLVLSGTDSPRPSRTLSRVIAEAVPDAVHRTIPYAKHMLPLTHTAMVNALIWNHMQQVDRHPCDTSPVFDPVPARRAEPLGMHVADA
jgi:pimeloyl-ACP methyl ester carboxylesterase